MEESTGGMENPVARNQPAESRSEAVGGPGLERHCKEGGTTRREAR